MGGGVQEGDYYIIIIYIIIIYIYTHFVVLQKLTQHCKAIILQ